MMFNETISTINLRFTSNWRDAFLHAKPIRLGNRLGTNFMRANGSIELSIDQSTKFFISQSLDEHLSGVVWDTALIISDIIFECKSCLIEGKVLLDLGCGTGVL